MMQEMCTIMCTIADQQHFSLLSEAMAAASAASHLQDGAQHFGQHEQPVDHIFCCLVRLYACHHDRMILGACNTNVMERHGAHNTFKEET